MKFGPVFKPLEVTAEQIEEMIRDGWMPALQFSAPDYSREDLRRLNGFCERFSDAVQIRFYFHGRCFDTRVLEELPDCTNLSIDAVNEISDFAPIAAMPKLRRLRFAVFEFTEARWIARLDLPRFTKFIIGKNRLRNFDLSPLGDAAQLEELFTQSHKGIEKLAGHARLRDVGLSGFPKSQSLGFLNRIPSLEKLSMILGTRPSIAELNNPNLRELSITRLSMLTDLGPLDRFPRLERLTIQDQPRLEALDVTGVPLKFLLVDQCKELRQITGLDRSITKDVRTKWNAKLVQPA